MNMSQNGDSQQKNREYILKTYQYVIQKKCNFVSDELEPILSRKLSYPGHNLV